MPLNTFFRITIDGQASPLLNNGITDLAGNQLAGSSGAAGTPFVTTFAVGPKLVYTDSGHNIVTLQLKQGGVMEMFRSADRRGRATATGRHDCPKEHLERIGEPGPRRHGPDVPAPIAGATGVRIRLKTPPFFYRAVTSPR